MSEQDNRGPAQPERPDHPGQGGRFEIIVNGQVRAVRDATVTFTEVVKIAFPDKAGDSDFTFVVTYRKAERPKEGSLAEGGSVEIKPSGTIFNVTHTRRS